MTCIIVQIFLILVIISEQTYQFFYSVSVSMILVPYFFSTLYMLVCVVKKDGFENVSKKMLTFYRVIAVLGFFYSVFLIYAGGLTGMMITTILYTPGILLYLYGQKERGEAMLSKPIEQVVTAAIVIFFVVSVYSIATGSIVL